MARKRKSTGLRQSLGSSPASNLLTHDVEIQMPPLHPGQWEIKEHDARFKIVSCGRRWGKTRLAVAETVEEAASRGLAWWIAPSYKTAHVGWRLIVQLAAQIPGTEIRKSDRMVIFPGGGEVWAKSGEDPNALRGEGLTLAVLDEAAYMKRAVWEEAIRAALSDRLGRLLAISTPAGYNYFYELFNRGMDPLQPAWQSWQWPTVSNPYILASEVEDARLSLPQRIFEQEYLARFIVDAGQVFRYIDRAVTIGSDLTAGLDSPPHPRTGFSYVMGVDWGQLNDFTTLYVMEVQTRNVVAWDRFNQIDFEFQRQRLQSLSKEWNVHYILAEENAIGRPNVEALQNLGLPVEGFSMQQSTKDQLIRDLALGFEQGLIGIPEDPVLLGELKSYMMERLPSGRWKYGAPEGMHDDCVIGLALADRAVSQGSLLAAFV